MNQALTLSIVIPAYNEENHLRACLEAIDAQSERPDEVVVVDNNSNDKTVAIAKSYSFVRIINEPQQGIVYARNTGFDIAKSNIIARIDADTRLPADWVKKIKRFYAHESNHKHAITGGGYFYNIRSPRLNGWMQSQLAYYMNRFIVGHYILWGSNMALLKSHWQKVKPGLCLRDDIHEDMDLAIHLVKAGVKITYRAKNLRVGVELRRVWRDREQLHAHMNRWPKTLKVHGYKLWWLGKVGNIFLWYVIQPIFFGAEYLARLFGRPSITGRQH